VARSQDKARSTASPTISQNPILSPKKGDLKSRVDPSKRSVKEDRVDVAVTGDRARDRLVGILYDALCVDSEACTNPPLPNKSYPARQLISQSLYSPRPHSSPC
jgi:hypothetical protein